MDMGNGSSVESDSRESRRRSRKKIENVAGAPKFAVGAFVCNILVGVCWLLRSLEFRSTISGPGGGDGGWLVMDVNVAIRRAMIVLAVVGLFLGLKALLKRCKLIDFISFVTSLVVCLIVALIVYRMGGKGFWFG